MGMRRYSFPFLSVMVVQLTPFLGTLRRKNLISANFGAFMYGLFLISSYIVSVHYSPGGTMTQIRLTGCFAFCAAFLRMCPLPAPLNVLQNKYVLWTGIGLAMRYYRPMFTVWTVNQVMVGFRIGLVAVTALGYWKINYGYNNSKGTERSSNNVTKRVAVDPPANKAA